MSHGRIRGNEQKSVLLALLAVLTTVTGSTIASPRAESAITTWRSSQVVTAARKYPTEPTRTRSDRLAVHIQPNYKNKPGSFPARTQSYAHLDQRRVQAATVPIASSHQNPGFSLYSLMDLVRLLAVLGFILLSFTLWFWALLECATTEPPTSRTRLIWMLIILFAHAIGALVYLTVRRPRRIRTLGR